MPTGDGAIVRAALERLITFLHGFVSPTGARGSVLLMTGGLVVLGFLFLVFLFRSAIVGDLAPASNARRPLPRAMLPPPPGTVPRAAKRQEEDEFAAARKIGRRSNPDLDAALDDLAQLGSDARILMGGPTWKRVRLYRCQTCCDAASVAGCERERGHLAGAFETLTGQLAKVEEVACHAQGAPYCEFEVHHAVLMRVMR